MYKRSIHTVKFSVQVNRKCPKNTISQPSIPTQTPSPQTTHSKFRIFIYLRSTIGYLSNSWALALFHRYV